MFPLDLFQRLPAPTASLILAALVTPHAHAYALPRETRTLPHRTLNVVPWPAPTTPPDVSYPELLRRQAFNTVCGFIGGDADLPVTCGAGSHCVADRGNGAIGCCPDGEAQCTTGIFTGCVDSNSGPQRVIDPYVFTCAGSDVCYRNTFAGGLTQVGCGTASDLATSVATSIKGSAALSIDKVSAELTASATTLSEPIAIEGGKETTSATPSSKPAASWSPIPLPTATGSGAEAKAPESEDDGGNQVGAIVGGSISGVAILIGLVALGVFLWKKRAGNKRTGPNTLDTEYTSPMANKTGFTPVATSQEGADTGLYQVTPAVPPRRPVPAATYYAAGASSAMAPGGFMVEADRVPLTTEYDFHRGYSEALTNIREEDEGSTGGPGPSADAPDPVQEQDLAEAGGLERPLWQQNRRQSRNMMWM